MAKWSGYLFLRDVCGGAFVWLRLASKYHCGSENRKPTYSVSTQHLRFRYYSRYIAAELITNETNKI